MQETRERIKGSLCWVVAPHVALAASRLAAVAVCVALSWGAGACNGPPSRDAARTGVAGAGAGVAGAASDAASVGPSQDAGGSAGGATREIRITTNTVSPDEVPPIPEGFEFLYATGDDTPATVNMVREEGDALFWGGKGVIWRAPADGSGDPVAFGDWENASVSMFTSDDTYLYWHDLSQLKRKRKDSTKVTPSPPRLRHNFPWVDGFDFTYKEETETLDLGTYYGFAYFDRDETHIYLAPTDCTPIQVIDIATFQVVASYAFERSASTGGVSSLVVTDDQVYCKNAYTLFAIDKDGTNARVLSSEVQQSGALTAVRAPETDDPRAYLLDYTGPGQRVHIKAIQGTGELVDYGQSPTPGAADPQSVLSYDASRRRLAWIGAGGGSGGVFFMTMNVDSRQFDPIVPLNWTSAFSAGEEYFYWAGDLSPDTNITVILRLHKDATAQAAAAYANSL